MKILVKLGVFTAILALFAFVTFFHPVLMVLWLVGSVPAAFLFSAIFKHRDQMEKDSSESQTTIFGSRFHYSYKNVIARDHPRRPF